LSADRQTTDIPWEWQYFSFRGCFFVGEGFSVGSK
jgi:hypothetical protein